MISGGCLCNAVRFEVRGPLGPVRYCHCSRCRRATGTAFSANSRVLSDDFSVTSGKDRITEYEMASGVFRGFCSRCGSPIYARLETEPAYLRVRLGTLEGDPGVRPIGHVWVDSKAPWFEISDSLPQADGPSSER